MAIDTESPDFKWYLRHVQFFKDKDVDGLLASDYTDDARLMSYDFDLQGHDQLKYAFTQYLETIGDFTLDFDRAVPQDGHRGDPRSHLDDDQGRRPPRLGRLHPPRRQDQRALHRAQVTRFGSADQRSGRERRGRWTFR